MQAVLPVVPFHALSITRPAVWVGLVGDAILGCEGIVQIRADGGIAQGHGLPLPAVRIPVVEPLFNVLGSKLTKDWTPGVIRRCDVVEDAVRNRTEASSRISVRVRSFPYNLVLKLVLAKDLVKHHLDVVACVPIAVIVEAARPFQNTRQLDTTRAHEFDIGLRGLMTVIEGPRLSRFPPKHLIVAIGVEWRVDVHEVNATVRQLLELLQVVPAVDNAGIHKRGRLARWFVGCQILFHL